MGFAEHMNELMDAAVKGVPILIVWKMVKSV